MGPARRAGGCADVPLTAPVLRRVRHLRGIADVSPSAWDALFGLDYPFTRHAFLAALESSGSVAPETGWHPRHLVVEDADGHLLAACPLYLKTHSYGEFVFDFAWARAAEQAGLRYYPRWVIAIPFTPSPGPRWAAVDAETEAALLQALAALPGGDEGSSLHALFLPEAAAETAVANGALLRQDLQYHWHNRGYADFEAFLAALSADKRKKIRRERRKLEDAGIRYQREAAAELSAADWDEVYALYASTYALRGQAPYLSRAFFDHYRAQADCPLWVLSGYAQGQRLMMALFLQSGNRLYGRHWGSRVALDGAHFETCYYQGIAWCIEAGLAHFDAGTQGDHKRARGFDPVVTRSAHWIHHPGLRRAVDDYLQRERAAVLAHAEDLRQHSAYRSPAGPC
jgi:uncharacterized protein